MGGTLWRKHAICGSQPPSQRLLSSTGGVAVDSCRVACVQLEDEGDQMISEVSLQHEATSSSSRAATPARSASSGHCANHSVLVISGDAQDSPLSY